MNITNRLDKLAATFHAHARPRTLADRVKFRRDSMTTAEMGRCAARFVLRALMEREPTDDEAGSFQSSGDFHRALKDPSTFERMATPYCSRYFEVAQTFVQLAERVEADPEDQHNILGLIVVSAIFLDEKGADSAAA